MKPVNLSGVGVRTLENPSVPLSGAYGAMFDSAPSTSGLSISESRAMQLTTVYACVKIIAETVASLPGNVYRINKSGTRDKVTDSPEADIIFRSPNELMSSFNWREAGTTHTLLWGNSYNAIEWTGAGKLAGFLPLMPWNVHADINTGKKLLYKSTFPGGTETIKAEDMLHVPGLSFDGIVGLAPIRHLRNALGLALAAEEFGARFFANDARPGVILEVPGVMGTDAQAALKQSMEDAHAGLGKKWRVMVAEQGMKVHEVGIPPQDAQFLETRRFQVSEIANIFRVPLPLLNAIDKSATYASVEQFQIQFVVHTITPWLVRWEAELNRKLWPRGNYCAEFDVKALLRGDFQTRMSGYRVACGKPWMKPNEVRAEMGLPADADPESDKIGTPLNMGNPGGDPKNTKGAPSAKDPDAGDESTAEDKTDSTEK